MRLVLVGPPGSGKGTQAKKLAQRVGLRYIGTGDILREEGEKGSPIGKLAKTLLAEGKLVPDDEMNALIASIFQCKPRPENFVLDGYPRTAAQARWCDRFLREQKLDLENVILFCIEDKEAVRRVAGRRVCPACSAVYHVDDSPPKVPGVCDRDGTALVQRPDDREEVMWHRLKLYHDSADDLIHHYRQAGLLREVPAVGTIDSIFSDLLKILKVQA